jgi:SH3 domain protein
MLQRALVLACLLLGAGAGHAQTRYVTDSVPVELRRGPSTEFLILRSLLPGERVDLLEQTGEGYSRVRVADQGTEGWILTRFLTDDPIARDKLVVAERGLAGARSRVAELEEQVATLSNQLQTTRTELQQIQATHGEVSAELADIRTASANVVEIRDQNESLRQRLNDREQDVDRLTMENAALGSRNSQNWFIVGAGVLFGGIVIGLIAPSLRRRRRSDW